MGLARLFWGEIRLTLSAMNHFGINVTLYTLTTFMPSILAGLGFTTRVQAQLLTVPGKSRPVQK